MTTRSKKTSRDDLESIAEKLDKLTDRMGSNNKSTESSLQELVKEFRELRKSQEFLEKQYEDMKNHLKQTDGEMVRLPSENKELQRTVQELRKTTSENHQQSRTVWPKGMSWDQGPGLVSAWEHRWTGSSYCQEAQRQRKKGWHKCLPPVE